MSTGQWRTLEKSDVSISGDSKDVRGEKRRDVRRDPLQNLMFMCYDSDEEPVRMCMRVDIVSFSPDACPKIVREREAGM